MQPKKRQAGGLGPGRLLKTPFCQVRRQSGQAGLSDRALKTVPESPTACLDTHY
jgi:hypothetical protein